MMPCFNAAHTLPVALASLLAQTETDWEAVIVDDGSTDTTWDILQGLDEPRLKLHRFKQNRGRGAARQHCLEHAQGEYLTFLDADDWWFPEKLQVQLRFFAAEPKLTAITGAFAITTATGQCIGMSKPGPGNAKPISVEHFSKPAPLPFPFAPTMIRMMDAKRSGFNLAYLRAQDTDFIIRALLGRNYLYVNRPLYACTVDGASLDRTLKGYHFTRRCFAQYLSRYPLTATRMIARYTLQSLLYKSASALGLEQRLFRTRFVPPTAEVVLAVDEAYQLVYGSALAQGLLSPGEGVD